MPKTFPNYGTRSLHHSHIGHVLLGAGCQGPIHWLFHPWRMSAVSVHWNQYDTDTRGMPKTLQGEGSKLLDKYCPVPLPKHKSERTMQGNILQDVPDCTAFTHLADTQVCFAWDYCNTLSTDTCTDCISGDVTCDLVVSCSSSLWFWIMNLFTVIPFDIFRLAVNQAFA